VPTAISRIPPESYLRHAAPLLTPLDSILAAADAPVENDDAGQTLIDESIRIVDTTGRVLRVHQIAYRALTESGAKTLGEDVFSYRRDWQKLHFVRAAVIQPDGTERTVAPDAFILQTPQRRANSAIYDDTNEVRVIFPHVKVGSVTHVIYAVEDIEARMPGAYTALHVWGAGWPTAIDRFVADLPSALASRIRWTSVGHESAGPDRTETADGRVVLAWRRDAQLARASEVARAPAAQIGPALRLTTLSDWDEVAAWFEKMLSGDEALPPALAAQLEEWTAGLTDPEAILRALFAKVADEVRYTSISLGEGDYRPRPPGEVWDRRHGDCKDKSNLLVALLRHKGIPAHLALLNTRHLGLIERRSPDYRSFDHAIVAIPAPDGGYRFCDPTIAFGAFGLLSPSSADREVLVVRDGRADWSRTPPATTGNLDHAFDLQLAPDGGLSGWMTLTADGLYAAWERERHRELDAQGRRSALARTVRGFFPGADVIDVAPPAESSDGPAVVRAYFLVPARSDAATGPGALGFPRSSSLFLDLGSAERRETPFFAYPDQIKVRAAFALPAGAAAVSIPNNFAFETPVGLARARWIAEAGLVRAELDLDVLSASVSPAEFPRLYRGMLALQNWFNQPLVLGSSADASPATTAASTAVDLPLLPTGAGQLALIEKRYPRNGDRALRRAALQRALQYFPNDPTTAFTIGIYLADLDWQADENAAALARLEAILAAHRSVVPHADIAWAEHLRALVLRDLGRVDEAIAILRAVVNDPAGNDWRRAQCALAALPLLEASAPAEAVDLLMTCSGLVSDRQASVLAALSRLLLSLDREPELRARLAAISRAQSDELEALLTSITEGAESWPSDPTDLRSRWIALARSLVPAPGEALSAAFARAEADKKLVAFAQELQDRLRAAVTSPPLAAWFADGEAGAGELPTWSDFIAKREVLEKHNDSDACVRLGVRAMLEITPSAMTIDRLWRVAGDADWHERRNGIASEYPILPYLLDLCDQVPGTHDTRQEGRFLRGAYLTRRGDHAAARDLFSALLADPDFPSAYRLTAHVRLANAHESLGDLEAAIEAARPLEDHVAHSDRNADRVFRSVLILLHLGRQTEAPRLLDRLEKCTDETFRKAGGEYFMREMLALRRSGRAEAFWAAQSAWWPLWEKIASELKLPPPAAETFAPVVVEMPVAKRRLTQAAEAGDSAAYWREFRTLVSAARWLPSLAPELSRLQSQAVGVAPNLKKSFLDLVLATLAVPGHPEDNIQLRNFHVVASLHDAGRHADALAAAADYRRAHPEGGSQAHAINRVRALSALAAGIEPEEAAAALESDLAQPSSNVSRAQSVESLANLYRALHRTDAETALLARELQHPRVTAEEATHQRLKSRHDQLDGGLRFAATVRGWLADHPLPWFDHAEPKSLDDPRLRNLEAVLDKPERHFNPFETIKLRLLAAQNPELGLARQEACLALALDALLGRLPSHDEALRLAETVLARADFSESLRAGFLWDVVIDAYSQHRLDDFARWRDHPLVRHYKPLQAAFVDQLARGIAVNQDDLAALDAFVAETTTQELDEVASAQLHDILGHFIRLDELGRARALVASAANWRYTTGKSGSRNSDRLQLARTLREAEEQAPVHRALAAKLLAAFPSLPEAPPASYSALRISQGALPALSLADTRDAGLWLVASRRFGRMDFRFWRELIHALHLNDGTDTLAIELFETALAAAPDDELRARVLADLFHALDHDSSATRARVRTATSPYLDPVRHPLSARYLRAQNVAIALRLDEVSDFEAALRSLDGPDDGFVRAKFALRRHLQRDDVAALRRVLRNLDTDQLLNVGMLPVALPALARAGLREEHELALETACREFNKSVLAAWICPDPDFVDTAVDLAFALGAPASFPPGWVDSISTRCPDPMQQGRARLAAAWLAADWEAASREALALVKQYPSYYVFHWHAGAALHRLGRKAEARPLLETYVRHARDELEHPVAVALLRDGDSP
jgi:transglutaminase-like putative cysteine protease/tetratricopeptide (TPR) repeat protein